MTTVELRRLTPDTAEVEVLARISASGLTRSAVVLITDPTTSGGIDAVLRMGVRNANGEMMFLADGEHFVQALLDAYQGTRLWAAPVPDDPPTI